MPRFAFYISFLSLHLSAYSLIQDYVHSQYTDLTSTDISSFSAEVNQWTKFGANFPYYYNCSGTLVMSGYNIGGSFRRTYSDFPPHNSLGITFKFYALDGWIMSDLVTITADGQSTTVTGVSLTGTASPNMCGGNSNDFGLIHARMRIIHNASTLTLSFTPTLGNDPTLKSYGIRDITISLWNTSMDALHACLIPQNGLNVNNKCTCSDLATYFSTVSGACQSCSSTCNGCADNLGTVVCLACASPYLYYQGVCRQCPTGCFDCDSNGVCYQCFSGLYLLSNGSCGVCNYPLVISGLNCISPCSKNQFLFWDQSCNSSCTSPLIQSRYANDSLCDFPCNISHNQYLYSNGSCISNCTVPYQLSIVKGQNICQNPCRRSGLYEYDNFTCGLTCSFPNIIINMGSYNHCSYGPCYPGEFNYQNNSCIQNCSYPYVQLNISGTPYCNHPCPNPALFYNPDGSCTSFCLYPLISQSIYTLKLCLSPCASNQFFHLNSSSCVNICPSPSISFEQGNISYCYDLSPIYVTTNPLVATAAHVIQGLQAAATTAATIGASMSAANGAGVSAFGLLTLNRFLFYMRFLEVNYPQNVKDYFTAANHTAYLSLGISFPTGDMIFPSTTVEPAVFDGWGLNSSYIANYWQTISTITLSIGILIFLKLIDQIAKIYNKRDLVFFISQFEVLVQWNFALIQFCTGYDSISLYASIEFRTYSLDDYMAIISFVMAILSVLLMFFFLGFTYHLAKQNSLSKRKIIAKEEHKMSSPGQAFLNQWKGFQILFAGYKDDSIFARGLIFFFMVRNILWIGIIVFLYDHPFAQGFLMSLLSLFMIIIMLVNRPFVNLVSKFEIPVLEIIICFVSCNVFALAVMDMRGDDDVEKRELIGSLMIGGFTAFGIIAFISMGAYFVLGVRISIKTYKKMKSAGAVSFLLMITIPFVSYGMDFKEFEKEMRTHTRKKTREKSIKQANATILHLESPRSLQSTDDFMKRITTPRSTASRDEKIYTSPLHIDLSDKYLQSLSTPTNPIVLDLNSRILSDLESPKLDPNQETRAVSRAESRAESRAVSRAGSVVDSRAGNDTPPIQLDLNDLDQSVSMSPHIKQIHKKLSIFSGRRRSLCRQDGETSFSNYGSPRDSVLNTPVNMNDSVLSFDSPANNEIRKAPSKFQSFRRESIRSAIGIKNINNEEIGDKSLHDC